MTKKEMVYEMIANTNLKGLNQNEIDKVIAKTKKSRIEELYDFFKENPTKAGFCLACIGI
jgi:hypothetical protein